VAAIAEDLLGEPVAAPVVAPITSAGPVAAPAAPTEASDEFDKLLSQISDDQKKSIASAEEQKQALLAEEDPLGETIPVAKPAKAEVAVATPAANGSVFRVEALGDGGAPQVALPAEVLAMALRPMVQEWLQENLAGIVEKLVKDEISKMNQS
jgi:cell pole-organizing protein PopZ